MNQTSSLLGQLNSETAQRFPGLQERFQEFNEYSSDFPDEVIDDMDGEQESLGVREETNALNGSMEREESLDVAEENIQMFDGTTSSSQPMTPASSNLINMNESSGLRDVSKGASKGVSEGKNGDYQRLINQCEAFLLAQGLIRKRGDFFNHNPPRDAADMIVAWIMDSCDSKKLDGSDKHPSEMRSGYEHAQKMRATVTFGFGHVFGKGRTPWHKSDVTGEMVGNPSVSEMVSGYMVSLRRRKVQSGEEETSARAITAELIGKLWDFNHQEENWVIRKYAPGQRGEKQSESWGGPRFRRALHLAYTLAFVCLLQVDEVLEIQSHDIEIMEDGKTIKVTLPFRKTDQFGYIQPFFIKMFPSEWKHLCPVRAYAEWIAQTRIIEGFILREMSSGDRHSVDSTKHMSSEQFLAGFRNNLLDIGVDPLSYGTHSFRRGSCQWLSVDLRWPFHKICKWAGWSTDFSYENIARYLISCNDYPRQPRESFFDMNRAPVACRQCGRTCGCS